LTALLRCCSFGNRSSVSSNWIGPIHFTTHILLPNIVSTIISAILAQSILLADFIQSLLVLWFGVIEMKIREKNRNWLINLCSFKFSGNLPSDSEGVINFQLIQFHFEISFNGQQSEDFYRCCFSQAMKDLNEDQNSVHS
jgi:hypothetical protein